MIVAVAAAAFFSARVSMLYLFHSFSQRNERRLCNVAGASKSNRKYSKLRFDILFRPYYYGKHDSAYPVSACLVGSEMCIRDRSAFISLTE